MNKNPPSPQVIGIIPARMGSSRFPGKPLAPIHGLPMVGHVYFRSKMSKTMREVYVATCDAEIEARMSELGIPVVMTATTHERASDRTAEAMVKIEKATGGKNDIVVMIQGDEPMVYPEMIDQALAPMLADPTIEVVNLMAPCQSREEHEDANTVKVVIDQAGFALYFSREPIPSRRKGAKEIPMWKQVCIIPFRRDFLLQFTALQPTPLEIVESVDMLRVMEHGHRVKMVSSRFETYSVDTPADLQKVEQCTQNDPLRSKYACGSRSSQGKSKVIS